MNILELTTIRGDEKILIISCSECLVKPENVPGDQVFTHTFLGTVHAADPVIADVLHYYIEEKGCTQIILIGHIHCHAINFLIDRDYDPDSPTHDLSESLKEIASEHHFHLVPESLYDRMLAEVIVVRQCQRLMEITLIRERISEARLRMVGVVYDERNQIITRVFSNGISLNNLVSLN